MVKSCNLVDVLSHYVSLACIISILSDGFSIKFGSYNMSMIKLVTHRVLLRSKQNPASAATQQHDANNCEEAPHLLRRPDVF